MQRNRVNEPHAGRERTVSGRRTLRASPEARDASLARAAFYGLYLRIVEGLAPDEAAALVMEQYPLSRPYLERLTRRPAADPLAGKGWNE